MTERIKGEAVHVKQLPPRIIVTLVEIKDKRDVRFDVRNSVSSLGRGAWGSHRLRRRAEVALRRKEKKRTDQRDSSDTMKVCIYLIE